MLYNVLAVWVLGATLNAGTSPRAVLQGIVTNPLIVGISCGVVYSMLAHPPPPELAAISSGLSAFYLPLVLVCIGGAMNLSRLYRAGALVWEATVWRLVIAPAR